MVEASSGADVIRCEFSANEAFEAGAAVAGDIVTSIDLEECLIGDNLAGGAISIGPGGIRIERCTIVGNEDGACVGEDLGWGGFVVVNSIIAYNEGPAFANNANLHADLTCCDICGNSGGNWNTAPVIGQLGQDGNIEAYPAFCDRILGDYRVEEGSPCAPHSPPNPECDLIGAYGVGCGVVRTEEIGRAHV